MYIKIGGKMSKVLYENNDLKLVESENIYFLYSKNMRVVFNEDCKIDRVCVTKKKYLRG